MASATMLSFSSSFNTLTLRDSEALALPAQRLAGKAKAPGMFKIAFNLPVWAGSRFEEQLDQQTLQDKEDGSSKMSRRSVMANLGAAVGVVSGLLDLNTQQHQASASTQSNTTAGRVPGLSDPDSDGLRTYKRPQGKSGGHGVGWSPIIPYSFKLPSTWEEVPVSIADLGGTEIDLRFQSQSEGNISVVVAPVLRFSDTLGDNVTIQEVGVPQKVINAFGPELTGQTVEGNVKSMDVKEMQGRTYYQYELAQPHMRISATAAGNRLYLFSVSGNGRQWKKFSSDLKDICDSFRVD